MKILFIGNSHTFFNDMPFIFSALSKAGGGAGAEVFMLASPGVSLGWHAQQPETLANIAYGNWDYVVLQQVAHPFAGRNNLLEESGRLVALINAAGAQPVLYMPWASKKEPGMQAELETSYSAVARKLGAAVAPVGTAWWKLLEKHPEIELFDADQEHASPAGSYLAACVFNSLLSGCTQEDLPATVTGGNKTLVSIPPNHAQLIQKFARAAVKNSPCSEINRKKAEVKIRSICARDRAWIKKLIEEHWGAPFVVTRGRKLFPAQLQGFYAQSTKGDKIGLITYEIYGRNCEIVTLDALGHYSGIGTLLIEHVKIAAKKAGCGRLWLITTNDNLNAQRFYQRRGFTMAAAHCNALEASRRIKPGIPETGEFGIPLRDEIEFEQTLSTQ